MRELQSDREILEFLGRENFQHLKKQDLVQIAQWKLDGYLGDELYAEMLSNLPALRDVMKELVAVSSEEPVLSADKTSEEATYRILESNRRLYEKILLDPNSEAEDKEFAREAIRDIEEKAIQKDREKKQFAYGVYKEKLELVKGIAAATVPVIVGGAWTILKNPQAQKALLKALGR